MTVEEHETCAYCAEPVEHIFEAHATYWQSLTDGDSLSYSPTLHDHKPHPRAAVALTYADLLTVGIALEARARWTDEGEGAPGPRAERSAYYRELADRFSLASLELLRDDTTTARMSAQQMHTTTDDRSNAR